MTFQLSQAKIHIVAAENFYGNIASLIGGDYVEVNSIINNPDTDPHLFTTSTKTAIAINKAQIIIFNGAGYDPWMQQLLNAQSSNNKVAVINVAELMQVKKGANPHIWYQPATFRTLAQTLADKFSQIDPKHKKTFELNLQTFLQRYEKIDKQIQTIKDSTSGLKVTATEPVFNYMAQALGFKMLGTKFQWVIMNDAEPTPQMFIAYQQLFTQKKVQLLFYNLQVKDDQTAKILALAQKNNIPVVGVYETMPQNNNVITWLSSTLDQVEKALNELNNHDK